MQLFQEYIVGNVLQQERFLFSEKSKDIEFLQQFDKEFWEDALYQRYNSILFNALAARQNARNEAGYEEFVNIKYIEINKILEKQAPLLRQDVRKKKALQSALNEAEKRFYSIQVDNYTGPMVVSNIKKQHKTFIVNNYIKDLILALEGRPGEFTGFDLTGAKKLARKPSDTKSKYTARGFQFPSRNTIRQSLRKWQEYTAYDLLKRKLQDDSGLPPVNKIDTEVEGSKFFVDLHIKYYAELYEKFLDKLQKAQSVDEFVNLNLHSVNSILNNFSKLRIDELQRSKKLENEEGIIRKLSQFKNELQVWKDLDKSSPVKITQAVKCVNSLKTIVKESREKNRVWASLLSKLIVKRARIEKKLLDPFDREHGDEARILLPLPHKKVTIKTVDANGKQIEQETNVPILLPGSLLYPIHDQPRFQNSQPQDWWHDRQVGNFYDYAHLMKKKEHKRRLKPFMRVFQSELDDEQKGLVKNKAIIAGGLKPNQDSPQRRGFAVDEKDIGREFANVNSRLVMNKFAIGKNAENVTFAYRSPEGQEMSEIIVNFLNEQAEKRKHEKYRGFDFEIDFKEIFKLLDSDDYKNLHDHIYELLLDNTLADTVPKMKQVMSNFMQRFSQLNFGSETYQRRSKKGGQVTYNAQKLKENILRFLNGEESFRQHGHKEKEQGRRHDVANRVEYKRQYRNYDITPDTKLQIISRLRNAYEPKFTGADPKGAALLCASTFYRYAQSQSNPDEVIAKEIERLGNPGEKSNCKLGHEIDRTEEIEKQRRIDDITRSMLPFISEENLNTYKALASEFPQLLNLVNAYETGNSIVKEFLQACASVTKTKPDTEAALNSATNKISNLSRSYLSATDKRRLDSLINHKKFDEETKYQAARDELRRIKSFVT